MRYITAAVATTLALTFGGCAGESGHETGKSGVVGDLGSVDAKLTLPEGFSINTVTYAVSGNGVSRGGDIDVTNSSVLRFRVGNLPVASNYTLNLTASTTDSPAQPCAGTASFDITSTDVTTLTMSLTCGSDTVTIEEDENGDLRVNVNVVEADGSICPVVTGISALPLETAVGSSLQLEGYFTSAPTTIAWSGPGGAFSSASTAATAYLCQAPGLHTLTFQITKADCTAPSSYTVEVECSGAPVDAGQDSGPGETDAGQDSGPGETDAGQDAGPGETDAGQDAGPPPDSCLTCMRAQCADYNTLLLAGPCFDNDPNGLLGALAQPATTQACTDAVQCSVQAPSNCADDVTGPARCYCGEQTIDACLAAGPVAGAECVSQWEAATSCPAGDFTCVTGAFQDLSRAAGYAFFTIECANARCPTECGLTP